MSEQNPEYVANDCYEALLDLKSIFPTWSDTQENFHYHWRQILSATTKGGDTETETLGFYKDVLGVLITVKDEGVEVKDALELVTKLDARRKEKDETFEKYDLEGLLGKDTTLIRPKKPVKKPPAPRRTVADVTPPVLPEGGHAYGTRTRTRQLQYQDTEAGQGQKLEYNSSGFGTHLKKGFFSDYVWDFIVPTGEKTEYDDEIDKELKDEIEYPDNDNGDDEEYTRSTKRSRKT